MPDHITICWSLENQVSETLSDKSDSFPLQRIPTGFSDGLEFPHFLRYYVLSLTQFGFTCYRDRTIHVQSRPACHDRSTLFDIVSKVFEFNLYNNNDVAMQGGTIHPPDESSGILYPSTPRFKGSIIFHLISSVSLFLPGLSQGLFFPMHTLPVCFQEWMTSFQSFHSQVSSNGDH